MDGDQSYGNMVMLSHADGNTTLHAHLSEISVSPGDAVEKGSEIGKSGTTGNSTGPHLHLALYYHGSPGENGMNYAEMAWPQYRE